MEVFDIDSALTSQITASKDVSSSLTSAISRDTRDNVFDPNRGSRHSLSVKLAGGPLGGTINFYKPGLIGVTGNVGKTSTKEAIRVVLSSVRSIRSASKNFNNELGLPLVILGDWQLTEGFFFWPKALIAAIFQIIARNADYPEILVLEYGVDRPGDMMWLLDIARPQIGVVTAMGEVPVHVEFFPNIEAVAREKEKF